MNKTLNVLVTGSNGQLGSELRDLSLSYKYNFFFVNKEALDIVNFNDVSSFITKNHINAIVNCAAYTAVDKAEKEQKLANFVNNLAVKNLAVLSNEFNIKLIHISTDYVFDGENFKPYDEDHNPNPKSVYGQTKLDGENAIISCNLKNSIIIRASWMYSQYGFNFVKTMIKLGKKENELSIIFDQIGAPTYAKDLAKIILDILPNIKNEKIEIYNYSNEGVLSWFDFAKEIMQTAKIDCIISPIETFQFPRPAKRPHYSLLNKAKIKKEFNITIPYWKDSLDNCLKLLGEKNN